jgi:hypothetical protein
VCIIQGIGGETNGRLRQTVGARYTSPVNKSQSIALRRRDTVGAIPRFAGHDGFARHLIPNDHAESQRGGGRSVTHEKRGFSQKAPPNSAYICRQPCQGRYPAARGMTTSPCDETHEKRGFLQKAPLNSANICHHSSQGRYPAARGMTTSPAFSGTCVPGNDGDSRCLRLHIYTIQPHRDRLSDSPRTLNLRRHTRTCVCGYSACPSYTNTTWTPYVAYPWNPSSSVMMGTPR